MEKLELVPEILDALPDLELDAGDLAKEDSADEEDKSEDGDPHKACNMACEAKRCDAMRSDAKRKETKRCEANRYEAKRTDAKTKENAKRTHRSSSP